MNPRNTSSLVHTTRSKVKFKSHLGSVPNNLKVQVRMLGTHMENIAEYVYSGCVYHFHCLQTFKLECFKPWKPSTWLDSEFWHTYEYVHLALKWIGWILTVLVPSMFTPSRAMWVISRSLRGGTYVGTPCGMSVSGYIRSWTQTRPRRHLQLAWKCYYSRYNPQLSPSMHNLTVYYFEPKIIYHFI